MKPEGLIFLVIGIALIIMGMIYTTNWDMILIWICGFIMVIVSIAITFPQKKGVNIE